MWRACCSALDTYPWSCSEQTVSRALPLLYLSKLSGAGGRPRRRRSRAGRSRHRRAAVASGFQRRLRPVVDRGRRGHLADRFRHRFPDPGARKQICRAAARDGQCARPAAQLCRQLLRREGRERRAASPMPSMCWRATAGRCRAICAISSMRGSTPSTRPSPAPNSPRRWLSRRPRPRRQGLRVGERLPAEEQGGVPIRARITARCCATAQAC